MDLSDLPTPPPAAAEPNEPSEPVASATTSSDGGTAAEEGVVCGVQVTSASGMPAAGRLVGALRPVQDPEIGISIVDLGLVYEINLEEDGAAEVVMTLTTMGCPLVDVIAAQVTAALSGCEGVRDVSVEFTFSPPWSTDRLTEEGREQLQAMGMPV